MNLLNMRVGSGLDVHALTPGRPLIIGGVKIAHETGLAGHSDADVLCHAIMDALLGSIKRKRIFNYKSGQRNRRAGTQACPI